MEITIILLFYLVLGVVRVTKEQFSHELGKRLSAVRRQRGMTQENVSEAANISIPYYSQIENGAKSISAFYLASIAKALNVSADYILFGKNTFSEDALFAFLQNLPIERTESIGDFLDFCSSYIKAFNDNVLSESGNIEHPDNPK